MLETNLHPTSQCRKDSFASNLLPRRSFWPHYIAFRSNSPFAFFRKRARAGSSHAPSFSSSCSCFAAHLFHTLIGPWHLFNVTWAHKYHVNSCLTAEYQCVPKRPLNTQITGFTHHCSCRSSYLSPHLNFLNLPHPRFFSFVMSFSCPNSFCPILCGHGRKLLLYFKAICFHE